MYVSVYICHLLLDHIQFTLIHGPNIPDGKESACNAGRFSPWVRKIPWRREWVNRRNLSKCRALCPEIMIPQLLRIPGTFFLSNRMESNRLSYTHRTRLKQLSMHACIGEGNEIHGSFILRSTHAEILKNVLKKISRALKTRGNTPKYRLIFHSTFIGRAAAKNKGRISQYLANKCKQVEERLSLYETGEIPRKNLDVMKEAMVQAEEAAAEITRKLEKQEKKRLKKEKKRLAAIALASSENSSALEECEETSERPKKKKKQKPQEALQENEMEDPSVSFSKPQKKKSFSKEELVSSDLEETAGTGSLPKRKKSFPKEETVTDPDESENKRVPKKKRKLSKEEPLSSGPEEAAASKSSGSKKKKKLRKLSQES
ncbi:hypothetical protein FD754_006302 [Muntiacus muntjak]|uniref:Nucleolar protein 5A n=1 Tax=Muntiacus muntjak TaxID=9888 RepID=A0A5N3WPI3_MUNMU|nr:hypothetical protein FD754_006302 [Muntiacus muntjak]